MRTRREVRDVDKGELLDRIQKTVGTKGNERGRASRILEAVEGMSVWEARELLKTCGDALLMTDVHYGRTCGETKDLENTQIGGSPMPETQGKPPKG